MKVLLLGSGGREHALGWALSASPLLSKLYAAPGNPGLTQIAECVPLSLADHLGVVRFCRQNAIEFVVIGPEAPLVAGLADDLEAGRTKTFGPSKAAARLEGSKSYMKEICFKYGIPTASYATFDSERAALEHIRLFFKAPFVVKADGLAAGKGVTIAMTATEAEAAVEDFFSGAHGPSAGHEIIFEEFLEGEEVSFFALCDGETAVPFGSAQDHKRAFDGDKGPNTGGMGAYSPAPLMTTEMSTRVMDEIINPTVRAMAAEGAPFRGVLFAGLMIGANGPKLIEYNVRFGDPECQALMLRLKSDLLTALLAARKGLLKNLTPRWSDETALVVVMAALGYPGEYKKGSVIGGLDEAAGEGVEIFHAGTKLEGGALLANGGRVLNVASLGATVAEARRCAYSAIERIDWPGGFYRRDIGWRAL
ncbi:MAG: phosphoribosylamine--glycine ligase [Chitinophagales bacterium]|nr:phosphoribosylamine--glycine ligase [Hyphomicrobiales bacterium]